MAARRGPSGRPAAVLVFQIRDQFCGKPATNCHGLAPTQPGAAIRTIGRGIPEPGGPQQPKGRWPVKSRRQATG
jgi:hypothetical protein